MNNPIPVLAADKIYEAYRRFVCKECAEMTAVSAGVTTGGYRLTVVTVADVVERAGYDPGPLTCECRRLEAVLDEQQQLQVRPGTPLPRPRVAEQPAPAESPATYPVTAMTLYIDGIAASTDPHPAFGPQAAGTGEGAFLVTFTDETGCFGVHTASCTLVMCQCEHVDHEYPPTAHPYLGARAGTRRAQHVGLVCDECATGHLADYLLEDSGGEDQSR